MKTIFFIFLFFTLSVSSAQTNEKAAVRTTIDNFFNALHKGDTTLLRQQFVQGTRLLTAFTTKTGEPALADQPIEKFIKGVGEPRINKWYEHIWEHEIRIDGRMAAVWAPYSFFIDDKLVHCGVNSFQLFKNVDGWKIVNLTDTRRKENCKNLNEK